ncbi:Kinase A inhibitor [Sulfitobacter sp. THAF37]|uniref:5-oxoprolinase subunit B family protein n=1 Tax=Sulfitobacter sp. THAF37 TaxID=2587855 RepID=UPI001268B4F9|nr:carboxyltransferase domain-containing protein [Sulfitobacter sp. THAF37]QFT58024.1 Kinase A inhibitor [Sulfitobacter sp. THAF37]
MSDWPKIRTVGLSGILITFAGEMSEPANRAALALRAEVEAQGWEHVSETSTSLVSTFLSVDLALVSPEDIIARLNDLLTSRDWYAADLPAGRRLWRIPTVYGTDLGPQLEEAAKAAGVDPDTAIREISGSRVRVLTLGFAPGQPFSGMLPDTWNIPRQQSLTKEVPAGALVVAIRQLIVFTNPSPTGWRHIGQTAFRNFRPESDQPIALSPGDELCFPAITPEELKRIRMKDSSGDGGAETELLS